MNQDVQNSSKALAQRLNNIAKNTALDSSKIIEDRKSLLDALLRVREFVQGIKDSLDTDVIRIQTTSEDMHGWPGFQVYAYYLDNEVGKLVIGAQERRTGPIMFFRNTYLDKSVELQKFHFESSDELHRTMKRVFREFTDEIESAIVVGNQTGSFDRSEETELSDIDLGTDVKMNGRVESRHAAHSASVYVQAESEIQIDDREEDDLSSLDLFN